jgi:hypothetical protein
MSDDILGSLKDAWGVEDDGPDPTKLSGLLELSEGWLEDEDNDPAEIVHHFETMRNNVVGAHMERHTALHSGKISYDPQFVALVDKNLNDMVLIEKALEKFIEASSRNERDDCWEALGELEESVEAIQESSGAIGKFLDSAPKVCMACSSIGEEDICPKCNGERLRLDPNPPTEDERKVQVGDEVLAVYESYQGVLSGKVPLTQLVTSLQSLEFTYLEAEAIGEQTLTNEAATDRIKSNATEMITAIRATLQGIEMMHNVVQTRSSTELNLGWRMVLDNSVKAGALLQQLDMEASELADG